MCGPHVMDDHRLNSYEKQPVCLLVVAQNHWRVSYRFMVREWNVYPCKHVQLI